MEAKKKQLEAEAKAELAAGVKPDPDDPDPNRPRRGKRKKPKANGEPHDKAQLNFTDKDSKILKGPDGFLQGYNCQLVVSSDYLILAAGSVTQFFGLQSVEARAFGLKDLMDAIRNDKPYSEVQRGVEASLVTSMGRMAAHTGQEIAYDEILNSKHEFAPGLDKLTMDSEAPLKAGPNGRYPVPEPGITKTTEY